MNRGQQTEKLQISMQIDGVLRGAGPETVPLVLVLSESEFGNDLAEISSPESSYRQSIMLSAGT